MVKERLDKKELMNYINGTWVKSGHMTNVINPATGEKVIKVPLSTKADVDKAVKAAKKAQKQWALVPAPQRAEILYETGRIMKERKEHLVKLLKIENGKVLEEARGEVQEGIDMAFFMAGEGRRLFGQTTNAELKDKFAMSVRAPIGVVGIITPWNFPIAIATWKAFPAIIAGNTVVWKPATETPMMAHELITILKEAGLPKGVMNVVFGSGQTVGNAIVHHPHTDVISFTGSNKVGRTVAAACGEQLKKVSLELGGENAVIVMDDANLDLAAESIIWSAYGTTGQRCTACSRVIVHEAIKEKLEKRLITHIKELTIGNGLKETVRVGPLINKAGLEKVQQYVDIGKNEGDLLIGGNELTNDEYENGYFFEPTLFTNVDEKARIAQEEIFGPVLSLIPVNSFNKAIEINNNVSYGLSSSIFTQDVNRVYKAQRDLDTGIIYVNAGTTGAEIHLPFGGTKGTGNGHRDSGVQALDVYTEWKAVYVDFSGKLQRAQIDTE